MGWILLLLLIGWPVLEIAVFIQVGEAIGLLATIALFLAAGAVGLILLRAEGFSVLIRAQRQVNQGIVPVREGFDALCLVMAGLLLLLPGFVTDVFALLLILPPLRGWLRRRVVRWVTVREAQMRAGSTLVIDGEFENVTHPDNPPGGQPDKPDKIVHRHD